MTSTTKEKSRSKFFLETSAVYYGRHGHTLMKKAVHDAVGSGVAEVSNFIRMEYLRGVVVPLIELYFLIKESASVSDALIDWTQSRGRRPRLLTLVLQHITKWIVAQEEWEGKNLSLVRLGNLCVRLVREFDEIYASRSRDDLSCELGRLNVAKGNFTEDQLFAFHERFSQIWKQPDCKLCEFKERQVRQLSRKGIDLYSERQRETLKANEGYVQQATRVGNELARGRQIPLCIICRNVGDTIIALHAPSTAIIVTADRSFVAFAQILGLKVRLLPSLAELKRGSP
jgi:hypothetical protein